MPISKPTIIKITNNIGVNLNQVATFSINLGLAYHVLQLREGADPSSKNKEDYVKVTKAADTVSFYYPEADNEGVAFRVGEHITREDFDRIKADLETLFLRTNNEA